MKCCVKECISNMGGNRCGNKEVKEVKEFNIKWEMISSHDCGWFELKEEE